MDKTKIICWLGVFLIFLLQFSFAGLSGGRDTGVKEKEIARTKDLAVTQSTAGKITVPEKSLVPAAFILVTDAIDGFGGQRYNGGCDLSIFAGGQSSAIGSGTSTNFNLYAGFVYPIVVKCGDANGDGKITVSDVVYLVNYLFKGGPIPKPYEAGEANCDGKITVSDVVYLVNYLFKGGPVPVC
jgi:hypothetical protein